MTAVSPATPQYPGFSFVAEIPAAGPDTAARHFEAKLAFETDPADVARDLERGADIRVLDVRRAEAYAECHIPGAISVPERSITAGTVEAAGLSRDDLLVVYCWSPACNGSTRAAAKLSRLGYRVKEMIGGLQYWRLELRPVEGTLGKEAPLLG